VRSIARGAVGYFDPRSGSPTPLAHRGRRLAAAFLLGAACAAGLAIAQERARTTERPVSSQQKHWEDTHRASRIIGTDVQNRAGERLGEIRDIVVDPRSGAVSYAVVAFGGFLGVGDKAVRGAWKAIGMDTAGDHFVIDADRERLRSAPGFDKDRWPDMADPRWNEDVHRYYGQRWPRDAEDRRGSARPLSPASGAAQATKAE
jgi:sporulation protein YlmC with PRC-barrel domain